MSSSGQRNPIKTDKVNLDEYRRFNYACSCEDCTHFDHRDEKCTFDYPTEPHLKRNQMAQLKETGEMAFCRAMEID